MPSRKILIFWDESHLWGLLALHAIKNLGLPYSLINSVQISQGQLLGKPCQNSLLLTPGGSARLKATRLGKKGINSIRQWINGGGNYLGFCGGAGLALSNPEKLSGLGICPWKRATFTNRINHLLSGHIHARMEDGTILKLPVWWPGRFEAEKNDTLHIMGTYEYPDEDLWIGNSLLQKENTENAPLTSIPEFPANQPLIIHGKFGKGKYLLSYAHLETPESPDANFLLSRLLKEIFSIETKSFQIKEWNIFTNPEIAIDSQLTKDMLFAWRELNELLKTEAAQSLFFKRTSWLLGWKQGIPGIVFNNLLSSFHALAKSCPTRAKEKYWQSNRKRFMIIFRHFYHDAQIFFSNYHNLKTGENSESQSAFSMQKRKIFGHPMSGGGIAGELLQITEALFF